MRQRFYLTLARGLAERMDLSLPEIVQARVPLAERMDRRLRLDGMEDLAFLLVTAALCVLGAAASLIWVYYYEQHWSVAVLLLSLNAAGGWAAGAATNAYRRAVRTALAGSDLPLRIALGQVAAQPSLPWLRRHNPGIEGLAVDVASTLPRHIELRDRHLGPGFLALYWLGAAMAMYLSLRWVDYCAQRFGVDDPLSYFGLYAALLPLLIAPVVALAYKIRVNADELAALLRKQMHS